LAIKAVKTHGYPTDKDWPYEPYAWETWNGKRIRRQEARPPLSVVRKAFDHRGPRGYYRAYRFYAAQRALAAGLPVAFGLLVDEEFTDSDGPTQVDHITPTLGYGHAMLLIGYQRIQNVMYGECLNWWHSWRSPRFFLNADIFDSVYDQWVIDP
jgi:hypothetical protein